MGKCPGLLVFSADQLGTNVLLVTSTSHTGKKETFAETTMITSAISGVGRLKNPKKKIDKSMIRPLFVSKSRHVF